MFQFSILYLRLMLRQQATKKATIPTRASIARTTPRGVKEIVSSVVILFYFTKLIFNGSLFHFSIFNFQKTAAKVQNSIEIDIANCTNLLQMDAINIANCTKHAITLM